ncbi:hypothetical protein RR46_09736 [Papilio xuthus]|uniref:Uncharacterized protein n=1 Tax=Papilio xuthus TaxID=66420 RepID=A0A194QAH2_PAPXU|nr:hypothetical protein RR46_09736 [Papilio xuthus]
MLLSDSSELTCRPRSGGGVFSWQLGAAFASTVASLPSTTTGVSGIGIDRATFTSISNCAELSPLQGNG